MSKTQNWKNAEYYFRDVYRKYNIPAERKSRAGNWGEKDFEVHIDNHPEIVSDSKYSEARPFRHHGLLEEEEGKYCKDEKGKWKKGFHAVLLTKNYKERGARISVEDEFFAMLLSHWLGYGTKEELQAIYEGRVTSTGSTLGNQDSLLPQGLEQGEGI